MTDKELKEAFAYDEKKVDAGIKKAHREEKGRIFGDANDKLPKADKHMQEVMKWFDNLTSGLEGEPLTREYTKLMRMWVPDACRSYARKVGEEIHKICTTTGPDGQTAFRIADKVQGVIDRLTDKEPA